MSEPLFRLSVKAIIFENDRLLLIHCRDNVGEFYYLPGGGQEYGETVTEALDRECREELGCGIVSYEIMFARDYFGWEHEFSDIEGHIHQVEMMFRCDIREGERPSHTTIPDDLQIGYAWIPIGELATTRFYPMMMRNALVEATRSPDTLPGHYLGSVN